MVVQDELRIDICPLKSPKGSGVRPHVWRNLQLHQQRLLKGNLK